MIDPQCEHILTMAELARAANPRRPIHISTGIRWADRGVKGHRLEVVKIGGRVYTSREALARFIAACNEPGAAPEAPNAAAIEAGRKLTAMGVR